MAHHEFSSMMVRPPATARRGAGNAAMTIDYDAPRHTESEDSLDVLKERHGDAESPVVDVEETHTAEVFELPGADLSGRSSR